MKLNSMLPQTLPKECEKAVRIFSSFVDSRNNGLDGVIPRHILENAKGFAIFTIFKAGFVFSARGGTGIVIAKLGDGNWSAPSAIGCAGVGVGSQLGAELTDFLIVLNSTSVSCIKSFMSAGSLTLGGNLSIAVGPLGRNGEAIGSLSSSGRVAAMYSYSKTRGLFGGVSVEGSVIVERQDANALAYQQNVTVKMLLSGAVPRPEWAAPLVRTIEACTGMPGTRRWVDDRADEPSSYPFNGTPRSSSNSNSPRVKGDGLPSFFGKKKNVDFPPQHWGVKESGSYFSTDDPDRLEPTTFDDSEFPSGSFGHHRSYTVGGLSGSQGGTADPYAFAHSRSMSVPLTHHTSDSIDPFSDAIIPSPDPNDLDYSHKPFNTPTPVIKQKPELSTRLSPHDGVARAIASYDFRAVEAGDLSFSKGDVITIIRKSDSTDDWWTGKINGREGIFPANFVELV
ncbi:hypothetical protein V8B97DRAFT_1873352 [Scleroderma yunnanense]